MKCKLPKILLAVAVMVLAGGIIASASESGDLKSNGIIKFDANNDGDTSDAEDVVIDTNDFKKLDTKITSNATSLQNGIHLLSENIQTNTDNINILTNSLGGLIFFEDDDGNKYVMGADGVPKNLEGGSTGKLKFISLPAETTVDVTSYYEKYEELSADNFIVEYNYTGQATKDNGGMYYACSASAAISPYKTYSAATGVLTIEGLSASSSGVHHSSDTIGGLMYAHVSATVKSITLIVIE